MFQVWGLRTCTAKFAQPDAGDFRDNSRRCSQQHAAHLLQMHGNRNLPSLQGYRESLLLIGPRLDEILIPGDNSGNPGAFSR